MQFRNQGEPMAPAHFPNVSWLLLAFVVLSTLAHGVSLLFPAEPVVQLSERRFGATIISTVLSPAKDQPALPQSHKAAPLTQPERPSTKERQLTPKAETTKPSTVSTISATSNTEFKTHPEKKSEATTGIGAEPPRLRRLQETPRQTEPVTTATAVTNNTAPLTTKQLASQRQTQRNYLLGELQSRLNRYLSYPVVARRRGWQGEVMVAFDINITGHLHNVRLAKSSGHSLLDRSAVNAINKLEQIFLPDTLGRLQAMELQLPVRYQLHES
ncbi:MAG: TonB family protein [Gammaproteobacteria bacterium]|nr:TonB family protein [Gammaproteobacteria bacterium]